MNENTAKVAAFRKELNKLMPGYKWTIHHPFNDGINPSLKSDRLEASGIQSSGSNRLSTLQVIRREDGELVSYESRSSGYGVRSDWLTKPIWGPTLAQSLRYLQGYYEGMESTYRAAASYLREARRKEARINEQPR